MPPAQATDCLSIHFQKRHCDRPSGIARWQTFLQRFGFSHGVAIQRFGLLLIFCLVSALPTASGQHAVSQPSKPQAGNVQRHDLAAIEKAIQNVAAQNRDACVAIFDGVGIGSGVIVSPDGLVLTAGHVMSTDATQYEVFFSNGKTALATRLGRNLDADTGMVKLAGNNWPHVSLGKTTTMQNGDWVVSLGHSGGYELGRKSPVRSGRLLSIKDHQLITDAVLIGGDSGGPLFNLRGELIGIHSSIGDAINRNRHARIEQFRDDWKRLLRGDSWGQLPELVTKELTPGKAKLGVRVDLTSDRAIIKSVKPKSPAARIGLRPNDIVIQFDGEIITDGRHLIRSVAKHIPADTCFIKIDRDDQILNLEVSLQ
jgi:serine protease Do